jgi:hypothetical protein
MGCDCLKWIVKYFTSYETLLFQIPLWADAPTP